MMQPIYVVWLNLVGLILYIYIYMRYVDRYKRLLIRRHHERENIYIRGERKEE